MSQSIVQIYVRLVREGVREIDSVPESIRNEVTAELAKYEGVAQTH
ncbi:CD1375 family protein [Paenibacillus ginsengihumi]|nr:CD1375 family protein [Paenibacillus ginsengihumi]